jgi:ABC-type multidrug transport system fused ATPase/permease subunit
VVLLLFATSEFVGKKAIERLWHQFNNRSTEVNAKAHEILMLFRTVRSFDAEKREYEDYTAHLERVQEVVCETAFIQGLRDGFSVLSMWGSMALLLFLTARMAARGEVEGGAIITLNSVMAAWAWSFSELFESFREHMASNISCAKLVDILEHSVNIPLHRGRQIGMATGHIEFRDVHFRYPRRIENAVDGLSFVIEPCETVAIVGESGCGKSTTLSLMQRFYDADSGQILLDGVDIREIDPFSLRQQISIVPQSPVMFSMSVKNNIRFGVPKAPREEVIAAAAAGNAVEFIDDLPQKYATPIGKETLSGGQKQRICIARAVMMRAPVLLLDEATAALDTENEALVQEALWSHTGLQRCCERHAFL